MSVIKRGVIQSYDPAAHKAVVQIAGSLAVFLPNLRVATNIPAADVVPGRQATVLLLDPSNPDDAVIVAVQGALPSTVKGGQASGGNLTLESTTHTTKGEVQVVDGSRFGALNMYGNYIGQGGADANTILRVRNQLSAESVSVGKIGVTVDPYWAPSADNRIYTGISGYAIVTNSGRTGTRAYGLDFVAAVYYGAFADLCGCIVRPQKLSSPATTISTFEGFRAEPTMGSNATITNYASFRSLFVGNSGIATAVGLRIDDITLGTTKYLIEAGPSTPNLRVEATTPASAPAGAEESRVLIAFRSNGGVVTLRRLYTRPFSTIGAAENVVIAA